MSPIGKGARFLVLSGDYRGQAGTVCDAPIIPGTWPLWIDEGAGYLPACELEGPGFKRLPDAPAEVDPLFAEIEAAAESKTGHDNGFGPAGWLDEIHHTVVDRDLDPDLATGDDDYEARHRALFVELAAIAIAGIRAIDRR